MPDELSPFLLGFNVIVPPIVIIPGTEPFILAPLMVDNMAPFVPAAITSLPEFQNKSTTC